MILCDGDDVATVAGNADVPTYMSGEEGNDRLNGGAGPNVILGGDGDDHILGGSSHDILVGGPGADRVVGNGGDDILISGELVGAADPIDLLDELLATLDEWATFRSKALTGPRLAVVGDLDADVLTGGAGDDWYFYDFVRDVATDRKREDGINIG
jgi:Ca2+-binding RTX toxin-like protein